MPIVWILGDWQRPEFAAAIRWLNAHARCVEVCGIDKALTAADRPSAIIVAQSRPGQISRHEVEHWHAAAPLARLIALLGPWCEGEMRSGRPWPGVVRVPWRTWPSRLPRELALGGTVTAARLPRTATEAERLDSSIAALLRRPPRSITAAIRTASRGEFESLHEALLTLGANVIWRQPGQSADKLTADVMLIDGWENAGELAESWPPRIVLLDFPRPEDIDRAAALGITAVIARPLLLADLAVTLDVMLPTVAVSRESAA